MANQTEIRCPRCGEKVIRRRGDSQELRGRITLIRPNGAVTVCKKCKEKIPIPIKLIA